MATRLRTNSLGGNAFVNGVCNRALSRVPKDRFILHLVNFLTMDLVLDSMIHIEIINWLNKETWIRILGQLTHVTQNVAVILFKMLQYCHYRYKLNSYLEQMENIF